MLLLTDEIYVLCVVLVNMERELYLPLHALVAVCREVGVLLPLSSPSFLPHCIFHLLIMDGSYWVCAMALFSLSVKGADELILVPESGVFLCPSRPTFASSH